MQQKLERYFQLCGNMLIPCFLFAVGLFTYLWNSKLDYDSGVIFHHLFLAANLVLLLIFINFNQGRAVFFSLLLFITYLAINYLKKTYGQDMPNTIWYHNIVFLLPLNLLFFYLFPPRRFIEKKSVCYLAMIATEYMLAEFLSRREVDVFWSLYGVNIVQWGIMLILFMVVFIKAVSLGKLYDYSLMFAILSLALGLYYSSDPVGLSIFFSSSAIIITFMVIYNLFYNYRYDELTGLRNRTSYFKDSHYLPPKYSLGIISIDGFDGLRQGLTVRQKDELIILLTDICQDQFSDNATVYRYSEDQFLIVCETMSLKEIRAEFENIRRHIASSEFMLHKHPIAIKITISGGVAEKKRTDATATEVLARANKVMCDTLKFSGNVISPVLRGERR